MRRFTIPVLILLLTAVAACTENPVSDTDNAPEDEIRLRIDDSGDFMSEAELTEIADAYLARLDVDTGDDAASKGRPSIEKATGSGHTHDDRFESDNFRTFAFVAVEKDGERTMGQWEIFSRAHGVRLHGQVDCLETDGNTAWFAGFTTDSSLESEIGKIRGFRVVDGEVDEISLTPAYLTAEYFCTNAPPVPMLDVERGNVTVH